MIDREAAWGLLTEFTQSESLRKHALAVEACMRACAGKYGGKSAQGGVSSNKGNVSNEVADSYRTAGSNEVANSYRTAGSNEVADLYRGTPSGVPKSRQTEAGALAPDSMSAEELWGIVGLIHDFDYEKYPSLDDHPYKGNEILQERGWPETIRRAIMSHAEYTGVTRDTPMEKALFACDELAGFITAVALIKPGKSLAEVDVKSVRKRMKDKAFARKVNRDDIINGAAALGVDLDEHIGFCIVALQGIAGKLGFDGSTAKPAGETAN